MPIDEPYVQPNPPTKYRDKHFPERDWDIWSLNQLEYEDHELRVIQERAKDDSDWGRLRGFSGYSPFLKLQSVVLPWSFAPDIMHLKDENVMKLYL